MSNSLQFKENQFKNNSTTRLPVYCVIPTDQQIPLDLSDSKKYPNVYMVNHVVYVIGHLKTNGQAQPSNCAFYNDCINTQNCTDVFELTGQPVSSVYPLHKQIRKTQLTDYTLFTEAGFFKAILMACNMPNTKKFLSEQVSLLQDIKQNNIQLTGFTEDSRIKKLIQDNNLTGIMESIINVQRDVLDIKYGKTEFMNKLESSINKVEIIADKVQSLEDALKFTNIEEQNYIYKFLTEITKIQINGLQTQRQHQRVQIDGHIYNKEVSLQSIKQVCENSFETLSVKLNDSQKQELRTQLNQSYTDIEAMNKPSYVGKSMQTEQARENQHDENIMSIMNLDIVKHEPKYLRICCLLLDLQQKLPSKIQKHIGRLNPKTAFKTNILESGIDNQETLTRKEIQWIHDTPNNLNSIKYISIDDNKHRQDYQNVLIQINKIDEKYKNRKRRQMD